MIDTASYGKALFQLAEENGSDAKVLDEIEGICTVLKDNQGYITLLDTPAVPTEEKIGLIKSAFGNADPILLNFMSILCEKHSVYEVERCADAYRKCYDEAHGLMRAEAITAVPLTERQHEALQKKLESITGKNIVLENRIDESLISGITLRYGGIQLDDSIKSRLDNLRRSLSETIV